jgi:hypothetical protein
MLKDEICYLRMKNKHKNMQKNLILNNNITMEKLFTAIHDGDHSAHLIEQLFALSE